MKKYLLHSIVTIIAGLVFFLIGEAIYNGIIVDNVAPLTLPVYFLVFMIIMIIVLWALSVKRGVYTETRDKKHDAGRFKVIIAISLVMLLLMSALLEFLYELGGRKVPKEATSYVFVIDDSGSMQSNDENGVRKDAVSEIVKDLNVQLPYAVYLFNDNCTCVKNMSLDSDNSFELKSYGGTDIVGALNNVYDSFISDKAVWGDAPKVLVLTDGQSSRFGLKSALKKYRKDGITVSAVGFGSADSAYLSTLANNTGGVYVNSDQISNLKSSMETAIKQYALGNRNLLSDRFCDLDGLYTFLRILFLIIISVIISVIKTNSMFDTDRWPLYMIISVVLGILASILMEVLISHVYMDIKPVHLICCIIWAFMPAEIESQKKKKKARYQPVDFDDFGDGEGYDDSKYNIYNTEDEYDDSDNRIDI